MAGMQRFVTYIYAYEEGKKSGNAGYAKIETRGDMGRVELHIMNMKEVKGVGKLSFFQIIDGIMKQIEVGEFLIERGAATKNISFRTDDVSKSGVKFEALDGLCVLDSEERKYLSFWHDKALREWKEESLPNDGIEEMDEIEQKSLHTMEIPVQNIFPDENIGSIWERWKRGKQYTSYDSIEMIQIELKDLRELPKKYWYLGNNSFLLHGFFNYHYIILGKQSDGKWYIGVPGMYQRQERVMASIFGFPGFFATSKDAITQMQPEEEIKEHQLGIWYHLLEDE